MSHRIRAAEKRLSRAGLASLAVLCAGLAAGCGEAESASGLGWEATTDTVADTIVVRTVSGSEWGGEATLVPEVSIGVLDGAEEYMFGTVRGIGVAADGTIYVIDSQLLELRVYGPDGSWRATWGRSGGGPGEFKGPDGGVAVLSDGRVLIRDPGNARIQVFAPDGQPAGTWPIRGGFFTGSPLWYDRDDHTYVSMIMNPDEPRADRKYGLERFDPDGVPSDTVPQPNTGYETATVHAEREGIGITLGVPFSPSEYWTLSPLGYFVHGISEDYRFTLWRTADLPLRIERAWTPVPVQPAERRAAEEDAARNVRRNFPDWKWNGPPVPDTKPAYRAIYVGKDGRIWLRVPRPGEEVENPDYDPEEQDSSPTLWREPIAFDVFEPSGRYLGSVATPQGFSVFPTPVFDGDHVWATTRDDLGVQRVVRFRVVPPGESTGEG